MVVEGAISQSIQVISVVPQGSVLGPLLFLLYIDSLSHLQLSHGTKMVLYVGDVLIYHFHHDYNSLQNDVNQIFNWSTANCQSIKMQANGNIQETEITVTSSSTTWRQLLRECLCVENPYGGLVITYSN